MRERLRRLFCDSSRRDVVYEPDVAVLHIPHRPGDRAVHGTLPNREYAIPLKKIRRVLERKAGGDREDGIGPKCLVVGFKIHHETLCHADSHPANLLLTSREKLFVIDWDQLVFAPKEQEPHVCGRPGSGWLP
jgi:RIO-like serine/threonine protein kinase